MEAWPRSWWQKIKTHPMATVLIAFVIALVVLVILGGYLFHWDWAGFNGKIKSGKTLWDWMQLLIIPAVLAVGGYVINLTISRSEQEATKQRAKTERETTEDNQREAALQAYIDKMSELLLEKQLRESKAEDEVRKIGRVRTLTVLPRLDNERKKSVLQFLHESRLIDKSMSIIDLDGADLHNANLLAAILNFANLSRADLRGAILIGAILIGAELSRAELSRADLRGAELSRANLSNARLSGADLRGAFLSGADLRGAILTEADLSGAFLGLADLGLADLSNALLRGAIVTPEQLDKALSLKNTILPDGSIHP